MIGWLFGNKETNPQDTKWNITTNEAIEKYGSALGVLVAMKDDGKPVGLPPLLSIAILELLDRIKELEKK